MTAAAPADVTLAQPIVDQLLQHVGALRAVAAEVLPKNFEVHAPDHIDDCVQALLLANPALALLIFETEDNAKAEFALLKAFELLFRDDPLLKEPSPSIEAFARTAAADRLGGTAASPKQMSQFRSDAAGLGQAERRRDFVVMARRLTARGRAKAIDRTPHPVNPNPDPVRDYRARINTLGNASRRELPAGREGAQIGGVPRPPQVLGDLIDPEGVTRQLPIEKHSDLVMLKGWRRVEAPVPHAAPRAETLAADASSSLDAAPAAEDASVNKKLDALRAEARALGVSVDPLWGIGRLNREIAAKKDNSNAH